MDKEIEKLRELEEEYTAMKYLQVENDILKKQKDKINRLRNKIAKEQKQPV